MSRSEDGSRDWVGCIGWLVLAIPALALVLSSAPAAASWLTRLLHEAGESGGKAARHGAGTLDNAAAHLKRLPEPGPKSATLAAAVSEEGHWTFISRAGERFTAGTPEELKRVAAVLAPEAAAADGRLTILLTEDTVFRQRTHLGALPKNADLHVLVGDDSYPLLRGTPAGGLELLARVRPNLLVTLTERHLFDEAVWQLARRMDKARIRLLALEPGALDALSSAPRLDVSGRAITDRVDPYKLARSLGSVRGQTLVVTGRTDGRLLHFRPASGGEQSIILEDLFAAASRADVNVVILQSVSPRQPGARNWLWQRVEVSGLGEALQRSTMADFLNAVAASQGQLVVTATERGPGRIAIEARSLPGGLSRPVGGGISDVLTDVVSEITGRVVTTAIDMNVVASERQKELELRLVPGIPSDVQYAYIGLIIIGLMGLGAARGWWRRLWPGEQREEYARASGYHAARVARVAAFVLLFLPLVAIPAALWTLAEQIWSWLLLPLRAARWLTRRGEGSRA